MTHRRRTVITVLVGAIPIFALSLTIYFVLVQQGDPFGVVITQTSEICAGLGADVLKQQGSAVDALITTAFCVSLFESHSMGLGGGFYMLLYDGKTKNVISMNARECAPGAATEQMLLNKSKFGIIRAAVPVELPGYYEMFDRFGSGKFSWKELIQPTLEICEKGIKVTKHLGAALLTYRYIVLGSPVMKSIFFNKVTDDVHETGATFYNNNYCKVLKIIQTVTLEDLRQANDPFTELFLSDLQNHGSIIVKEDFLKCKPVWEEPVSYNLPGHRIIYSPPLPSCGILVGFMLRLFWTQNPPIPDDEEDVTFWNRMVECMKFAFGQRTKFADPTFTPESKLVMEHLILEKTIADIQEKISQLDESGFTSTNLSFYGATGKISDDDGDHGTEQICILAPDGTAISFSSSIGKDFASGVMLPEVGIILNGQLNIFQKKPTNEKMRQKSLLNYLQPYKRPLTSKSPIIITRDSYPEIVIGASGTNKIFTSIFQVLVRYLYYQSPVRFSVVKSRLHHSLNPMKVQYENPFRFQWPEIIAKLSYRGHRYSFYTRHDYAACLVIKNLSGYIAAFPDPRKSSDIQYVY